METADFFLGDVCSYTRTLLRPIGCLPSNLFSFFPWFPLVVWRDSRKVGAETSRTGVMLHHLQCGFCAGRSVLNRGGSSFRAAC
jgi:hypothetical protein